MKRKDLYNYIREEIVDTLSETTYVGKGAKPTIQQDPKWNNLKSDAKKNALADLDKGGDVELEEMARPVTPIKIKDTKKFALAKEVYSGEGKIAKMLKAIEEAGTDGITQKQLGVVLGLRNDAELNPFIRALAATDAINSKPKKETDAEEPDMEEPEDMETPDMETPDIEEPDMEEPEDSYGTEEEPETPEEEPTTSKADTGLAADIEKLAQLKVKLKNIMNKYRDTSGKISDIENYKKEAGTLPQQIKDLEAKLD